MDDPRWLAKVVSEVASYRRSVEEITREMCWEYFIPKGECNNHAMGWSRELGEVYKLLKEAEARLRELEQAYAKRLKAAVLQELASERARELLDKFATG